MKDLNMYKENTRRILTRLHGKIQYDILASVLGQLSDGKWLNSPRMEMYWRNASVVLDNGYDVVLEVKEHVLPYCAMSDAEILQWFGKKIKQLIKDEFGNSRAVWSRTNTKQKTDYLSHKYPSQTSVADCYFAYDTLMGRDTDNKKYRMESVFNKLMDKKVIKESISNADITEAIERAVYNFDWDIEYDDIDVIAQLELEFCGEDYRDEYLVEQKVTAFLKKHYRELANESVKPSKKGKVVTEGIMERLLNKFREAFENWTPQNGKNLDREDGINDYDEPYYCWEQEVWVALNDEGKIYVEANGLGFVSEFELDEAEVAKLCIDQCLYDLGYGDVNFESVGDMKSVFNKLMKESTIKEAELYDASDELEPFENDYVPTEELIRKEAMAQLRYEDIPYSEAKMLVNDIVAMLTGQPFDSKSEFELNVSFEIRENLRAFYESKKVDKSKKVIKESLNDLELKQAITTTVNKTNLPKNLNKQEIINDVYELVLGKDFEDQANVDEAITDYLEKTYGVS